MKKMILAVSAVLALSAGVAFAAQGDGTTGMGVLNSKHDMLHNGYAGQDAQSRVCAFCHTPHHADMAIAAAPLWSRELNGGTAGTAYTAYASGSFDVTGTAGYTNPVVGPTQLCLSCHDSNIAIDTHYAYSGSIKIAANDSFGGANIGAGQTLANDHPVGFAWDSIVCPGTTSLVTSDVVDPACTTAGLKPFIRNLDDGLGGSPLVYKNNAGITVNDRLFNLNNHKYMTCATCHDVHNRKNKDLAADTNYFVLAPQANSDLCLTCHIK